MNTENIKVWVLGISLVVILSILFVGLLWNFGVDNNEIYRNYTNYSNTFLYNSSTTITSEEGVISSSIQILNQTWLTFDGADDSVGVSDVQGSNTSIEGANSVNVWFRQKGAGGGNLGRIAELKTSSKYQVAIRINDSGRIQVASYNGSLNPTLYNQTTMQQWNMVTAIYNNNSLSFYINGELSGQNNSIGFTGNFINPSYYIQIGNLASPFNRGFNGDIDEIRVYNRNLSSSEITQLYNSGRTANSSLPSNGLIAWYSFNEASGTTIYDKSDYRQNGTLYNF